MPETLAGLRDSSLLPRLWDGEPQRWCKFSVIQDLPVCIIIYLNVFYVAVFKLHCQIKYDAHYTQMVQQAEPVLPRS